MSLKSTRLPPSGGIPHICGGYDFFGKTSECIKMSLTDLTWDSAGSLPNGAKTSSSGSDHSPQWGLIVSGGLDENDDNRRTVLKTMDGLNFESLPDLPEASARHCLTIVDNARFLVAGGGLDSVYIYDSVDTQWIDIGALPSGPVDYPACGVVQDLENGLPLKVVIAGVGSGYDVDIYNLETNEWESGGVGKHPKSELKCSNFT